MTRISWFSRALACLSICSSLSFAVPGFQVPLFQAQDANPILKGIPFRDFGFDSFFDERTRAVVVVFAGIRCPRILKYIPTLEELKRKYESKGVRFLLVYPDREVNTLNMALHAMENGISWRTLWDYEARLAKTVETDQLTEAVVFNPHRVIVYQGAIDDSLFGSSQITARERYLEAALEDLLSNRPVKRPATLARGCTVEKINATSRRKVTYYEHVLPILQKRCQNCHRPGEIGEAFGNFLDHSVVESYATTIRDFIVDRRMPPYYTYVNPKYGRHEQEHQLTQDEVDTIVGWVSLLQTAKEDALGDPAKAPAPLSWPKVDWKIGTPDEVLRMKEPYVIQATGKLDYQFFRLPLNYPEDRWIQAVEAKPGNTKVVHHMQLHIVPADTESYVGTEAMTKLYGIDGERGHLFHSYVPGDTEENARVYPLGTAMRIPAKTDLILEMHYTPIGKVTEDQSSVGMIFAKQAPKTEICSHGFKSRRAQVVIPAFSENTTVTNAIWFRKDVLLHNLRAHMHELGRSVRLNMVHRRGKEKFEELFAAFPVFDFAWQRSIQFKEPVLIPAGQEIMMTGYWDNSKFNPNNSDPSRTRYWGIHTSDEMFNVGLKYSIVHPLPNGTCEDAIREKEEVARAK